MAVTPAGVGVTFVSLNRPAFGQIVLVTRRGCDSGRGRSGLGTGGERHGVQMAWSGAFDVGGKK